MYRRRGGARGESVGAGKHSERGISLSANACRQRRKKRWCGTTSCRNDSKRACRGYGIATQLILCQTRKNGKGNGDPGGALTKEGDVSEQCAIADLDSRGHLQRLWIKRATFVDWPWIVPKQQGPGSPAVGLARLKTSKGPHPPLSFHPGGICLCGASMINFVMNNASDHTRNRRVEASVANCLGRAVRA